MGVLEVLLSGMFFIANAGMFFAASTGRFFVASTGMLFSGMFFVSTIGVDILVFVTGIDAAAI
jgi:hypothetical protein